MRFGVLALGPEGPIVSLTMLLWTLTVETVHLVMGGGAG
jgi:hypothetical protein